MKKSIKVGSDFSGVGAFNQALRRLGIEYDELFACDMDKYARQTFILNYGTKEDQYYASAHNNKLDVSIENLSFYFPTDVYQREIPKESLDIYMTSPPCQAFSMAGKRLGKEDKRGVLFFNSLEFIQENKPRYFIFENVKGLLSHDKQDPKAQYGRTFQEWINYLGGKSVNGVHTFFPYEDAVPYHIYFQVLNAKDYNIPQNRQRIFIIGIRDDEDNNFQFPKPIPLTKRLKDVLEPEVDEKYFLSDKMLELIEHNGKKKGIIADLNKRGQKGEVYADNSDFVSCLTATDYKQPKQIQISTWCTHEDGKGFIEMEDNLCPTIPAIAREDGSGQPVIKIGAIRGRNPQNPKSRETGLETEQMLEINENGTSNALTTVQKDNVVVISANTSKGYDEAEEEEEDSIDFSVPNSKTRRGRVGKKVSQTLDTQCNQGIVTRKPSKQEKEEYEGVAVHPNSKKLEFNGFKDENCPTLLATDYKAPKCIQYNTQRIRRLTPRECFNLMDFNQEMIDKTIESKLISDSQLYRQAGNSIAVGVLAAIIEKLKL
jgi:DNA (cytosine-5)-methyltransferase 1